MRRTTDSSDWTAIPAPTGPPSPPKVYVPQPMAVQVGDQILVFPPDPPCVAKLKSRKGPCGSRIVECFDRQQDYKWHIPGGGFVRAYYVGQGAEARYTQQHCTTHEGDWPDAAAPMWEVFDPEKHRDLIKYRDVRTWTPEGLKLVPAGENPGPVKPALDTGEESVAEVLRLAELNRVEPTHQTALYSFWDSADVLLYVGITDNEDRRHSNHVKGSSWMDFSARSTIERFDTRKEAEAVERERIKTLQPLFNHTHNSSPEAARRLVEYLVQHGRADLLAPAVSRG